MDEKLSQSQIDELFRAISSGDTAEIKQETAQVVREYDFRNPQKFSKDQLRSLEMMFDSFSRQLSSFMSGYLRTQVEINVASAEQVVFREFTNTLSNPVIMGIVDFSPFKGSIFVELSCHIGYAIIDRVLGGPGHSLKRIRDFSEIEQILLERILNQTIGFMVEPWHNVEVITPRLERLETNPQFAQVIAPNETTALVTLEIKVGGTQGFLNFVIPHMVIESHMDKLNSRHWFMQTTSEENDANYAETLEERLQKTIIPVRAIIGKTRITVGEFVSLRPGDIITLDSFVNSDLIITIGDLYKFKGKPGVSRGKNAVRITSLIDEEELTGG